MSLQKFWTMFQVSFSATMMFLLGGALDERLAYKSAIPRNTAMEGFELVLFGITAIALVDGLCKAIVEAVKKS